MLYLVQSLSFWLLAAVGLGLIVGLVRWKAPAGDEKPVSRLSYFLFALLLAAGATVAWMGWLPGRYGLWLETALLLLIAYLVGCALGCFSRGWFGGGGTAAKPAPLASAKAESPVLSEPAEDTAEETEAFALSVAALEVFDAAREILAEAETEIETETDASPPASATRPQRAEADDLRRIQGVNADAARRLHDLGVWRFEQFAAWTPPQQRWIGEELRPIGTQVLRFWIAQARLLAGGVETEFARALRHGEARRERTEAPLVEAAAAHFLAGLPQLIAPHATDEIYAGERPLALLLPPYGEKDELRLISGVDTATAQRLNTLGIWTFGQIARWSVDNARWIGSYLAFPGRVEAENWVAQARDLAQAGEASESFRGAS